MDELTDDRGFVAEEFLTWLWWSCEAKGGRFLLPGGGEVSMAIEDQLTLRGDHEGDTEDLFRGGIPTRSREAGTALAIGKRLAKAKIVLASSAQEWTLTFDATNYRFSSVRVPRPDDDDDRTLATFKGFEDVADSMDALFGSFLAQRLAPAFAKETLPQMRKWIATKAGG